MRTASPLEDYMTLRDVASQLRASYYAAYALAASGALGEPFVVGRQHFYPRAVAEPVIRRRLEQRRRDGRTAPLMEVA
jgi:hypothetical protein